MSECVTSATRRDAPAGSVVGVRPEQVAHWAFVGHFNDSVNPFDLVQGVQARGEPAVQTENLVFDDRSEGQVVKEISQEFPDVGVAILAHALVIESIDLGNLAALVVPSENCDSLSVAHLEADQKRHGLDGVVPSIYVIAHEQVVGVRRLSANFE